jgi:hypothetical protein
MISKTFYLFLAFSAGATVMIFEIIGARILAPYIGTSFVVWTSLIGFVLASLSLGYYIGGKWIDKKTSLTVAGYAFLGRCYFYFMGNHNKRYFFKLDFGSC